MASSPRNHAGGDDGDVPVRELRGLSLRGSELDTAGRVVAPTPALLAAPHGGVWAGREWPGSLGAASTRERKPVILAFGDSHTKGMLGTNYVDMLQARFPQFRFVNCGVNGQVLESIRRRVEPTLQAYGDDVVGVIVMGGTNDCLANLNPSSRKLIRAYNPFLEDLPSLDEYPSILRSLLRSVYGHTSPVLNIVCVTPPMLGEDPEAMENHAVDRVCAAMREVVREFTQKPAAGGSGGRRRSSEGAAPLSGQHKTAATEEEGEAKQTATVGEQPQGRPPRPPLSARRPSGQPQPQPQPQPQAPEQAPQEPQPQLQHHHRHHHHHQHHHGRRRRRLHVINFNARMKQQLAHHYPEKRRKRLKAKFLDMCYSTTVSVMGGIVTQSYETVSDVVGYALHNDGVHMNERAVRLLVDMLECWVERVHEDLYLTNHTAAAAAAAVPASATTTGRERRPSAGTTTTTTATTTTAAADTPPAHHHRRDGTGGLGATMTLLLHPEAADASTPPEAIPVVKTLRGRAASGAGALEHEQEVVLVAVDNDEDALMA